MVKPTGIRAPSGCTASSFVSILKRIRKCCCFVLEWDQRRAPCLPLHPVLRRDLPSGVWPGARRPLQPPHVEYSLVGAGPSSVFTQQRGAGLCNHHRSAQRLFHLVCAAPGKKSTYSSAPAGATTLFREAMLTELLGSCPASLGGDR